MYFIPVRCKGSIFHRIFILYKYFFLYFIYISYIFCYISDSFQLMKLDLTNLIGELSFLRVCACPWQIQTCTRCPRQTLTHPWPHGKCSKGELWVPWEDTVICPTAGVLSASCILVSFCSSKKTVFGNIFCECMNALLYCSITISKSYL